MRQVIDELPLVPLPVLIEDLPESLLPPAPKLALVLHPISPPSDQPPFSLIQIVLPLSLVDQVAFWIDQLPLPLHLALDPIPEVIASIVVNIFPTAVTETIPFFSIITVAVSINLTCFNIWTILRYQSPTHFFTHASIERVEHLAETVSRIVRVELRQPLVTR